MSSAFKQVVRSSVTRDRTFNVCSYGGNTRYPVYTVEERSGSNNSILHVCSGRYARENAFKRFRMFAFGTEYR